MTEDFMTSLSAALAKLRELGYEYTNGAWSQLAPAPVTPEPHEPHEPHEPDPEATERALHHLLTTLIESSSGEAHGKIKIAMEILKGER